MGRRDLPGRWAAYYAAQRQRQDEVAIGTLLRTLAEEDEVLPVEGHLEPRDRYLLLDEDRVLVESAQRGYGEGFRTGPPHRLEARILHQQAIYAALLEPWYALGRMPR